ncbi:TPA: ead/Ea22-like family protein [Citrobacter braakii]
MTALNKQALRDNANSIIGILENIAGYEPSDIDGDNVELRFEDECGVDTGCDVSIVDQCHKAAEVMRSLLDELDELEAAEKRIAELEAGEVVVKQFDDFQIVHYGGSEDYAKGYIDCQNNYNKALTAAGIGVKGE